MKLKEIKTLKFNPKKICSESKGFGSFVIDSLTLLHINGFRFSDFEFW